MDRVSLTGATTRGSLPRLGTTGVGVSGVITIGTGAARLRRLRSHRRRPSASRRRRWRVRDWRRLAVWRHRRPWLHQPLQLDPQRRKRYVQYAVLSFSLSIHTHTHTYRAYSSTINKPTFHAHVPVCVCHMQTAPLKSQLPCLEELILDGCGSLANVRLAHKTLKTVSIQGCAQLGSLALACPGLSHLDLSNCATLKALGLGVIGITTLGLGKDMRQTRVAVLYAAPHTSLVCPCKRCPQTHNGTRCVMQVACFCTWRDL